MRDESPYRNDRPSLSRIPGIPSQIRHPKALYAPALPHLTKRRLAPGLQVPSLLLIQLPSHSLSIPLPPLQIYSPHERERQRNHGGQEEKRRADLLRCIDDGADDGRAEDGGAFVSYCVETVKGCFEACGALGK